MCFQYPDGSGGNITTSDSAAASLPTGPGRVAPLIDRGTIVLAAPEVPLAVRRRMLELGTHGGALRIAAFSSDELRCDEARRLLALADLVSLNQEEAASSPVGRSWRPRPHPSWKRWHAWQPPRQTLVVTAGAEGVFARTGPPSIAFPRFVYRW